jgi:hypothetical protein
MKNIHLVATPNPSRLAYYQESTSYNKPILQLVKTTSSDYKYQNIYITSNEEIKKGDWYLEFETPIKFVNGTFIDVNSKKIILTTDQDLIKDGVQKIDDEFLEWFVKNPSCEEVEVLIEKRTWKEINWIFYYKIIIPKEEQKKDKDVSTLEAQYEEFLFLNSGTNLSFEEWEKVNVRLIKQAIINMMKADEELGLYDEPKPFKDMLSTDGDEWNEFKHSPFPNKKEPFKHKVEIIPAEEILANRSNVYEFIVFDLGLEELNPHIGPFLLKNGFEKFKYEDNIYTNSECTINVLEGCYEILFENEWGEVSAYTDSWSIPHLVGVLTWNDLIDRNYIK